MPNSQSHDIASLLNVADARRQSGKLDEARRLFHQALAIEQDNFQARFGLAMIGLAAGDLAEAERQTEHLIRRYGLIAAAGGLGARIALARRDFEAALARLAPLLANAGALGPEQRADVLLLRSEALDGLDRTAEAFDAAVRGKAILHSLFAARAASREREVAKLSRLADWFAAADPEPWRTAPAQTPTQAHVFLIGFPRSGTTLLEQVLAGHPDVTALEEAPTLASHYAELMTSAGDLERLAHLSAAEAEHWRAVYWETVRDLTGATGPVFLDKAPAGTLYLPLIAKLFPKAKILFAVRDPRDVVLSCLRNNFQLNAMTYEFTDLGRTAACYDACMRMAQVYRRVLPLDLREVRHETLVEDFDAELAGIGGFLGLEITPGMADIAATSAARAVRTPSAVQVREGLSRRGLGRWRAYRDQLEPVMAALAPWVERFGYGAD